MWQVDTLVSGHLQTVRTYLSNRYYIYQRIRRRRRQHRRAGGNNEQIVILLPNAILSDPFTRTHDHLVITYYRVMVWVLVKKKKKRGGVECTREQTTPKTRTECNPLCSPDCRQAQGGPSEAGTLFPSGRTCFFCTHNLRCTVHIAQGVVQQHRAFCCPKRPTSV